MPQQQALIDFILHLADDALILGHRNSEWTGHGPILEQDIAISNIALDLIGQARNFYQYAALLINRSGPERMSGHEGKNGLPGIEGAVFGTEVTEDSLAYLRDGWDFKNSLLAEQSNGNWARTILRQFFISTHQFFLYERLRYSKDAELAAITEKACKEVAYHLRWSSEWVIRLGDGTAESHARMEKALEELWKFTGEFSIPTAYEQQLAATGIGVDSYALQQQWEDKVREVFAEATLSCPEKKGGMLSGGKEGRHTEQLGYILAEMQFLQRAYPGCEW